MSLGSHRALAATARRSPQRGLGPLGLLVGAALLASAVLLVLRVAPAALEWWTARQVLARVVAGGPQSAPALRAAFDRQAQVEGVTAVAGADLDIERDGDRLVAGFRYERRVRLAGPVSLLIEFSAESRS